MKDRNFYSNFWSKTFFDTQSACRAVNAEYQSSITFAPPSANETGKRANTEIYLYGFSTCFFLERQIVNMHVCT